MIEDREITGILKRLREIGPSADFVARSRSTILATPRSPRRVFVLWSLSGLRRYAIEGFGFALSVGLASLIIVLFISSAPKALDPVIGNRLPGADTTALLNEAYAAIKDIDIHLQEAQLFDTAARTTGAALKETANNSAPHANPLLIKKESDGIAAPSAPNANPASIDKILDQLIK